MRLPARRCEVLALMMGRALSAEGLVKGISPGSLGTALRDALFEDLSVEDRLNDEVRELLVPYAEQMRQTGADYHEAFKKAKAHIVRQRKLVL